MKKFLSLLLSATISLSLAVPAFAAEPTASSDVSLQSDVTTPDTFNVIVPAEIPIYMGQNGDIQVSQTLQIQNKSSKAVEVIRVQVDGKDDWQICDFGADLGAEPANTHDLALRFRGDSTDSAGNIELSPNNWQIEKDANLALNADAKLPLQTNIEKSSIATVVWTIDWAASHDTHPVDKGHEITVLPGENGTVDSNSPIMTDDTGKIPQFPTPIPDDGYVFVRWEDANGNPVDGDTVFDEPSSIKPVFIPDGSTPQNGYTITILPGDHGNTGGVTSIQTNPDGQIVSFPSVYPDDGYSFAGWQDEDGNLIDENTVFDKAANIVPIFEKELNPVVSILPGEHGNIGGVESIQTDDNHRISMFPETYPDEGYLFDHWEDVNGNPVDENTVFSVGAVIKPVFVEDISAYEDFVVSAENRSKIGFTGAANEALVIPESFDDADGTHYRVIEVGDLAFKGCTNIISVEFPETLTRIGNSAFSGCSGIASPIVFPDSLEEIGDRAFELCTSLPSFVMADSTNRLGNYIFAKCSSLTSGNIPTSLTAVPTGYFPYCTKLSSIVIPDGVTSIGGDCFKGTAISTIDIPESITYIGAATFPECPNLTYVKLPSGLKSIEATQFRSCPKLESVEIPYGVETIKQGAFDNCPRLILSVPDSVTRIEEAAFKTVPQVYYNGPATGAPWSALKLN